MADALIRIHSDLGIRGFAINLVLWKTHELRRFAASVLPLLVEAGVWVSPKSRGWSW